jgi:predicted metal-dependent HD superfamily phosphohydrolase
MNPAHLLLKDQFQRASQATGLTAPEGVFESLASRYGAPDRAYHTLQHIAEGLGHLKAVRVVPPEVPVAWWFHDSIYDPRRDDNEEKSAAWAVAVLGKTALAGKVKQAILATKPGAYAADPGARLVVDIDLAILASPEPRFSEYQAQLRREQAFVDEANWRRVWLQQLRSYSDRAFIYQTPEFRVLETRARKNIERVINAMIVGKK